jgi:hypothetical protein
MRREGGVAGSQPMSTAVHRSPNKLWRSNSIFNLWFGGKMPWFHSPQLGRRSHFWHRILLAPPPCWAVPVVAAAAAEGGQRWTLPSEQRAPCSRIPGVQKLNQRGLGVKISKLSSYKMSPLCSVSDPDPGSGTFLTPGSGMGKRSGSGMITQLIFPRAT